MSIADKLSYLNDTKEGLRIAINQLGGSLTKTTPFRNYADGLNYLYSKIPKVEAEGENITFNDVASALMKLDLKGNTSQTGTPTPSTPIDVNVVSGDNEVVVCGKNLIPFTNQDFTLNGLRYYVDNGNLYVDGTSSGETYSTNASFKNNFNFTLPAGTYTLQRDNTVATYIDNKATGTHLVTNSDSFTLNETTEVNLGFYAYQLSFTNQQFKVQLEKGSTATTYEPYQSQTYPINLPVDNLFDKDNANVSNVYINANGVISNADTRSFYLPIKGGETYTIQRSGSARLRVGTTSSIPTAGVSIIDYQANDSDTSITITTSSNANYLICYFYATFDTNTKTYSEVLDTIQVEKGNKANHYTPYGTTPIELCKIGDYQDYFTKNSGKNLFDKNAITDNAWLTTSGTEESQNGYCISDYIEVIVNEQYRLPKLGTKRLKYYNSNKEALTNTWDISDGTGVQTITIPNNAKYVRFSINKTDVDINTFMFNIGTTLIPYEPYGTGLWCKYNAIGKVVLDGSESGWANMYLNNQGLGTIIVNLDGLVYQSNNSGICNYFIYKWVYNNPAPCFYVYNEGNVGRVMFITQFTTKQDFLTWLSTHNTIVYYVLATPYLSPIEDNNLIEQLDNLEYAMSYEGQTNISQENNDLPFIIDAKALTKIVFEEGE